MLPALQEQVLVPRGQAAAQAAQAGAVELAQVPVRLPVELERVQQVGLVRIRICRFIKALSALGSASYGGRNFDFGIDWEG